ncbi:pilus assembly protein TadG-related protein [Acidimicrobium ferrooxidans]|uniref:pilus assembly protein TadG-related protein n=1 Tax=Acidimicrobium ferrooxidans TaxID=53635 RepID=UPI0005A2CBED|nr:pilus assembly protein TadG-related protein [Acidimicrobium ferrooxidans]
MVGRERAEAGSALVLIPILALATSIMLLVIGAIGALGVRHAQLRNLAASCALYASRAVSTTAWEATGQLAIDPTTARLDAASCLGASGVALSGWSLTVTPPMTVTVALEERLAIPVVSWLTGSPALVQATASATQSSSGPG